MTALAGIVAWNAGGRDAARDCAAMLAAQAVYAPDDRPVVRGDADGALGRRLLSRLPEDAFDRGPVVDARGRTLVADARIDNRDELCAALGLDGRRLSDPALLSAALERWDEAAFDRVVGDFAAALWDPAARRLLLARDYLVGRPLHYHLAREFAAFASMPKGLHALAEVPRASDPATVAAFVALRPEPVSASFFAGVAKVPPGHWVAITPDRVVEERWWRFTPRPVRLASPDAYAEALRAHFDTAVRSQLRGAEDAVAAQLSGGFDSAAVAATAARLLAPSGGRVVAYTSVPREGFDNAIHLGGFVDEGPLAAETAALHGMEHHLIRSGHRSPLDRLDTMPFLYDRPILNLCNAVWSGAILDAVKARGIGAMLTGAMGNAGFSHSGMERLTALFAERRWPTLVGEGWRLWRGGTRAGTVAAQTLRPFLPDAVMRGIARVRRRGHGVAGFSLVNPGLPELAVQARPGWRHGEAQLFMLGRVDRGNWIKGMQGGWGVEMRDPTADRRLIEFCLSVPVDQFLRNGVPRALARRAFADRLPAAVLRQRRKGQQAADWYEGMGGARDALAAEIAHIGRNADAARLLDLPRAERLLAEWPEDEAAWRDDDTVSAYRIALLRGISTGHFLRKVAGTN